jgi:hypothetical protein
MNKSTYSRYGESNPNYKDGRKKTRLYRIYYNMLARCYNSGVRSYRHYGQRGIEVCPEWRNSFEAFQEWSMANGYTDRLTIDRINNCGNYEPGNCRWVTTKEQSLNTSRNRLVQIGEDVRPLTEWCRMFGINPKTVRDRLKRGWNEVAAIQTPIDRRWSH